MSPASYSRAAAAARSGPIDEIFAMLAHRPDIISFAVGSPDTDLLPVDLMPELVRRATAKYGPAILQYGMTQGFDPLLGHARELLGTRGISCPGRAIHIATGGSGALHNLCMALLDEGDVVLVESPTYGPAVKGFRSHGATVREVACDEFGIVPEALAEALSPEVAFLYMLPTFQNPTGRTVPAARRQQLAEVVLRRGALVIEDDVYADLRYHGDPVPALWSYAPENTVYLTSLSKTFAPAVRIGIVVLPERLSDRTLALKQNIDMQTSTFCQAVATEFLESGHAEAHLARIIDTYSSRLDTLVTALDRYFSPEFRWRKPDGGMFLWLEGPPGFDADIAVRSALEQGVAYLPGSVFYAEDGLRHRDTIRLSFANVADRDIDRGIKRLMAVFEDRG
ncbi:PLP-dependent aminotransferase family protein [Nocardia wallacei]|uniref:aminotransferase-like domain-containing protein n=1 Tax=Nocardia wallacei TaxID=480035 RepID=UPI002455261A|nr:PLP-dependent aminotransferase family protein [Nocardia wallacei]